MNNGHSLLRAFTTIGLILTLGVSISADAGLFGDSYEIDNIGDLIIEAAGEGNDFVHSSVNFTLVANLERVALNGAPHIDATGNTLDNSIWGNLGNNVLTGGRGNDYLSGDAGNDTYVFNRGDGQDAIDDTDVLSATDILRFGPGIAESAVQGFQVGMDMVLKLKGTTDHINFINYYGANTGTGSAVSDRKLDSVAFANGTVWNQTMIQTIVDRATTNRAPTVNTFLPALQATTGSPFTYTVPVNTVIDADVWDSITYSVKMADGSAVPSWLTFDATTNTLSGTPDVANVGSLQFALWGTDRNVFYSAANSDWYEADELILRKAV